VVALYKIARPKRQGEGPGSNKPKSAEERFRSDAIFEEISERAGQEHDLAKKVNSSFRFKITNVEGNETKNWTIDLKRSPPFVGQHNNDKVDAEISVRDDDFVKLASGKLKPDQAFLQGKMKIKGNIMKAMKLKTILDPSKLKARL